MRHISYGDGTDAPPLQLESRVGEYRSNSLIILVIFFDSFQKQSMINIQRYAERVFYCYKTGENSIQQRCLQRAIEIGGKIRKRHPPGFASTCFRRVMSKKTCGIELSEPFDLLLERF